MDRNPEIQDSLVIGQPWENDERIILFIKLKNGKILNRNEEIKKGFDKFSTFSSFAKKIKEQLKDFESDDPNIR